MDGHLQKVGDLYRIESRLKEIDESYELFFNRKTNRFEVYSTKKGARVLAFVSPFDELDSRLITYARRTRSERAAEIIAEIDKENEKIEKRTQDEKLERLQKLKMLTKKL